MWLTRLAQVVGRVFDVPLELGGSDGAHTICDASHLRPSVTLHGRLLWLHHHDHLFCRRGKLFPAPALMQDIAYPFP
jgi:hypothetical protein